MPLRLGTRNSKLARWQAEWVAARLRERGVEVELTPIATTGDRQQDTIVTSIGGQGVFTKEIQRALLDGRIDMAVHSLKDLPTGAVDGLRLAAVPSRGPAGDALIANKKGVGSLFDLPPGATVCTGSLRRQSQLLHCRPDLHVQNIRGNVETRIDKLQRGDGDALVLAEAGVRRLGLERHIACLLPLDVMLPAVGQGALGIEIRADDRATRNLAVAMDHRPTHAAVLAERAMLAALLGGCSTPIAALACADGERLTLTGRVVSRDGGNMLDAVEAVAGFSPALGEGGAAFGESDAELSRLLGRRAAESLLARGARKILAV